MTDKEFIKKEIERRINNLWHLIPEGERVLQDKFTKDDANNLGKYTELESLLKFIDSLPEPASEDLEEAAEVFYNNCNLAKSSWWDEGILHKMSESKETFIAGAEWQKQQMKETLQTEYEKGRFDMMEEMMKDAVEGTVKYEIGSAVIPQCDRRYQVLSDPAPIANAKLGDKVKIIIVKTEQQ